MVIEWLQKWTELNMMANFKNAYLMEMAQRSTLVDKLNVVISKMDYSSVVELSHSQTQVTLSVTLLMENRTAKVS